MAGQAEGRNDSQGKGSRALIVVLIVVVVLLIFTVGLFAAYYFKSQKKDDTKEDKRQKVINEETVEEVVDDLFEEEEDVSGVPSSYETVMSTVWHFPDGTSSSTDAYVENAEANVTDMYFDVVLAETEEKIYESPVLALGAHVDEIKLMRDLDPGTYDCVLTYHLVDSEQKTLGTIDVAVTVIVEN